MFALYASDRASPGFPDTSDDLMCSGGRYAKDETAKARAWLMKVPRILLHTPAIDACQLVARDPVDILGSVDWKLVDGLLAGKLGVPREMVSDEIRPSMMTTVAECFRARICGTIQPERRFDGSTGVLMLERTKGAIPEVDEGTINEVVDAVRYSYPTPWEELLRLANAQVLLGTFFCTSSGYGSCDRYLDFLNNDLDERLPVLRRRTLRQKLDQARWLDLWSPAPRPPASL